MRNPAPILLRLIYVGIGVWAITYATGITSLPFVQSVIIGAGILMVLVGVFSGPLK